VPVGPRSTADLTPTLTWTYAGCAPGSFEIQVSRDPSFPAGRNVAQGTVGGSARDWTSTRLSCGTFSWRVRAVSPTAVPGAWGGPMSMEVRARVCP
jgi:hypothetical protein